MELRDLTAQCVHCGFCLSACPTYQLDADEADSPRGRIYLVNQLATGAAPELASVRKHLDSCLGCLACVPACPSGVAYDRIITQARPLVEPGRPPVDRLRRAALFAVFPYPRRLAVLRGPLRLAQALRLHRLHRILPSTVVSMLRLAPPVRSRVRLPRRLAARAGAPLRGVVGLLTGCVQSAFFSDVSAATAQVLAAEGYDVVVPATQGCCGALSSHSGRVAQARRMARRTVAAFERAGVDVVVTDVAGCGSAMKEYAELLGDDAVWGPRAASFAAKVRDVTELLASEPPLSERAPLELTVAYHDACHLSHGQRVRSQPRELLRAIPGLRLVPIAGVSGPDGRPAGGADVCCGSAGVYNLLSPQPAARLAERKAAAIRATGADVVVAGNPGCLLQIRTALEADGGPPLPAMHTIEILAASLLPGAVGLPTSGSRSAD